MTARVTNRNLDPNRTIAEAHSTHNPVFTLKITGDFPHGTRVKTGKNCGEILPGETVREENATQQIEQDCGFFEEIAAVN